MPRGIIEPGMRCTAYYYATQRGLPVTMCYLLELGLRGARAARWLGIPQATLREGFLVVNAWPEQAWHEAAASIARDPAPRHAHPHPPLPEPRYSAWEYAGRARALVRDGSDAEFVRDLHRGAWYVAGRRGIPAPDGRWPESVLRDVLDAMAQNAAEHGTTGLYEDQLDAVAAGFFPDPGYRSRRLHAGAGPDPRSWASQPGEEYRGFWSYAAPPEDTQAYADWSAMADEAARREPDLGWPPMSSEDM